MSEGVEAFRPEYGAAFNCIGSRCEDHCCGEWNIPLDKGTYERYKLFPVAKLGGLVEAFVVRAGAGASEAFYAQINVSPTGACPFFEADRLCGIQKEYGAELLSATCSIYPRSLSRVEGRVEASLSLSCPEAARNVLLGPGFLETTVSVEDGAFRKDNIFLPAIEAPGGEKKPFRQLVAVRALLIAIVRDRSRALGERLLLLGELCRRMEAVGDEVRVAAVIDEFHAALESGRLEDVASQIEGNPRLRLEIVMRWTSERVQDGAACGRRFADVFWSFVEGIGTDGYGTGGDDVERFVTAEKNYARPWFDAHPHVLENYILNYVFQHLFPFGRTGSDQFRARSMSGEWLLMAAQWMWVESLLIGVAGRAREAFDADDVVKVVQSFTRATEHFPEVLDRMLERVAGRRLDSVEGMAALLRRVG